MDSLPRRLKAALLSADELKVIRRLAACAQPGPVRAKLEREASKARQKAAAAGAGSTSRRAAAQKLLSPAVSGGIDADVPSPTQGRRYRQSTTSSFGASVAGNSDDGEEDDDGGDGGEGEEGEGGEEEGEAGPGTMKHGRSYYEALGEVSKLREALLAHQEQWNDRASVILRWVPGGAGASVVGTRGPGGGAAGRGGLCWLEVPVQPRGHHAIYRPTCIVHCTCALRCKVLPAYTLAPLIRYLGRKSFEYHALSVMHLCCAVHGPTPNPRGAGGRRRATALPWPGSGTFTATCAPPRTTARGRPTRTTRCTWPSSQTQGPSRRPRRRWVVRGWWERKVRANLLLLYITLRAGSFER